MEQSLIVYTGMAIDKEAIVLGVKCKDSRGEVKMHNAASILRDKELIGELNGYGAGLQYKVSEAGLPALVSTNTGATFKLGPLAFKMGIAQNKSDSATQAEIMGKLAPVFEKGLLTKEEFTTLATNTIKLVMDLKGSKLHVSVDPTALQSPMFMAKIASYNNTVQDDTPRVKRAQYEDTVMTDPTGKVMFQLSNYETLLRSEMMNYEGAPMLEKFPLFSKYIEPYKGTLGLSFVTWADNLKNYYSDKYSVEDVIGRKENNDLPIQENEREFYEQMVNIIRDAVKSEKNVSTDEEVDALLADGIQSTLVEKYLKRVAEMALYLNRNHTGRVVVPEIYGVASDMSSDDSGSSVDDETGSKEETVGKAFSSRFQLIMDKGRLIADPILKGDGTEDYNKKMNEVIRNNGMRKLEQYMRKCVGNPYAWAEAIVKLLRWGARKPTSLSIRGVEKNGNQLYLDLNTFAETEFSGDWSKEVPRQLGNGADRVLNAVYTTEGNMVDVAYLTANGYVTRGLNFSTVDVVVGVSIIRPFESGQVQTVYMDLATLVEYLENQEDGNKIMGIEYNKETGEFTVDSEVEKIVATENFSTANIRYNLSKDIEGKSYVEMNADIMKIAMEIDGLDANSVSMFDVWSTFLGTEGLDKIVQTGMFSTRDEYRSMIASGELSSPKQALLHKAVAMYGDIPLYLNKELGEMKGGEVVSINTTLHETLTAYKKTNRESGGQTIKPTFKLENPTSFTSSVATGAETNVMESEETVSTTVDKALRMLGVKGEPVGWIEYKGKGMKNVIWALDEVTVSSTLKDVPFSTVKAMFDKRKSDRVGYDNQFDEGTQESMKKIAGAVKAGATK